jgi:hypothetical protein
MANPSPPTILARGQPLPTASTTDREAAHDGWQQLQMDVHKAEAALHRGVAAASPILPRDGSYRRLPTLLAALQNDLTEPYIGQTSAPWPHDQRSRPAQVRPELTIKGRYQPSKLVFCRHVL